MRILLTIISIILTLLTAGARTGPDEAISNLSNWATRLHLPRWMRSSTFTKVIATTGPVFLTLCVVGIIFWPQPPTPTTFITPPPSPATPNEVTPQQAVIPKPNPALNPTPSTVSPAPHVPEAPPASARSFGNNFYTSFSFPNLSGMTGDEIEIQIRFINNEENPILVENISLLELFGNAKEQYKQLDECYDPDVIEFKNKMDEITPGNSPIQGGTSKYSMDLVTYRKPAKLVVNGAEVNLPLPIMPKQPIVVVVSFGIYPSSKKRTDVNFFVVCPTIKFFDTRGQEAVSMCPGLIDMWIPDADYRANSYLIPSLIARREHHLTGGRSDSGDKVRELAQRPGWFQLTPKIGTNSCPSAPTE